MRMSDSRSSTPPAAMESAISASSSLGLAGGSKLSRRTDRVTGRLDLLPDSGHEQHGVFKRPLAHEVSGSRM